MYKKLIIQGILYRNYQLILVISFWIYSAFVIYDMYAIPNILNLK